MSLNKPKYTILRNTKYALSGLKDILINESSFKFQVIAFFVLTFIVLYLPFGINYKLLLFISLFIPVLAEIINSAIERVVDLVTLEYHEMAKRAKDVGATIVFVSIIMTFSIWVIVFYINIKLITE